MSKRCTSGRPRCACGAGHRHVDVVFPHGSATSGHSRARPRAPVKPAIPWEMWRNADDIEAIPPREIKGYPQEHWLVGPLDGPATGDRLDGFLGAARNGAAPKASRR